MYTTSGEYWNSNVGKEFLKDPEGFKRKRQNREYTAKEKQEIKYLNMSKQDVTNESFLEAEWDHMPRTKLSDKLVKVYEKNFKSKVEPKGRRIKQKDAINILKKLSSTDTYVNQILETVQDPAFEYSVPVGIVGTKIDDMDERELLLWLGAADSKQTTSFFVTKIEDELAIAEDEDTLAADIDWALQSSTLDLSSGRPTATKRNRKKSSLKQSSSLSGLNNLNGNSNSMILDNQLFDGNNSNSSMFRSVNKYGQKSRYSAARPAGLPGRTYHLHGLPCRLYDIFGEPRERPVRVGSVVKYDLNKTTNERFAKIEQPVRRATRNAATEILKNSRSTGSLLLSNNNNSTINNKEDNNTMMLGGAGNSTMDSINESSTIMQQLNSSISNVFYQQSLSLRPGVSIEVKPGMLNFGRLCIGQTYQLTFSCLNISLESLQLSLISTADNNDWLKCKFLKCGALPPGLSRRVEVRLIAKKVGTVSTIIRIKSPDEILEMPIAAHIELPTKHNPRTGPRPNVVLINKPLDIIQSGNNNPSLVNETNNDAAVTEEEDERSEDSEEKNKSKISQYLKNSNSASKTDTWKLAQDDNGEITFPIRVTPRN